MLRIFIALTAIIFTGLWNEASAATTKCAIVYSAPWGSHAGYSDWYSSPIKGYCPANVAQGTACELPAGVDPVPCGTPAVNWIQAAVDRAASDAVSTSLPHRSTVYLTAGTITISALQAAWGPFKSWVGIHVKPYVDLVGSPSQYGTTLLTLSNQFTDSVGQPLNMTLDQNKLIRSIIFVGKYITGPDCTQTNCSFFKAGNDNLIKDLTISGAVGGDINCSEAASSGLTVEARSAIFVSAHTGALEVKNVHAFHLESNAFEFGVVLPFIKDFSAANTCTNDLACYSQRLRVEGSSATPVQIHDNSICDSKFGGVVLVGHDINVHDNDIQKIGRRWPSQSVGSTMGVSASFAGTTTVNVYNNTIQGGDYSVGTDGSYPLYVEPPLFCHYWTDIVDRAPFAPNRYPDGCPMDADDHELHFICTETDCKDYILAQQVLYDLASEAAAVRGDTMGFGSDIEVYNNQLLDASMGVSFFKMNHSRIHDNLITAWSNPDLTYVNVAGIDLNSSYSVFVYNNTIGGWSSGVRVYGLPPSASTRAVSPFGAAYNGIGTSTDWHGNFSDIGNTFTNCGISVGLTNCGDDNSVRHNTVSSSGHCVYSGATRSSGATADWTDANNSASCDCNYWQQLLCT